MSDMYKKCALHIQSSTDQTSLERVTNAIERMYNYDCLTQAQFIKLGNLSADRQIELSTN